MDQYRTHRTAAGRDCRLPQFPHDPANAPAGVLRSKPQDQLPRPPGLPLLGREADRLGAVELQPLRLQGAMLCPQDID